MKQNTVHNEPEKLAPEDCKFMFSSENLKKMVLELSDHQRSLLLDIIKLL